MPTVEVTVRDAPRECEITITRQRPGLRQYKTCKTDPVTGTGTMFNVMPGTFALTVVRHEGDDWVIYEHPPILIAGVKNVKLSIGKNGKRRGVMV